jgi:branched-chain amino acid transport system substrate-binding protein
LGYEVLHAVKLAVRRRNDAGGVAGAKVELIALDDGLAPRSSAAQARVFSVDVDVMGVIGPFSEATVLAAAPVYQEVGLAMVTPAMCAASVVEGGDGSVFCLGLGAKALSAALIGRVPAGSRTVLLSMPGGALGGYLSQVVGQVVEGPWSVETLSGLAASPADVYLYDGGALAAADLLLRMRDAELDAPLWGGPVLARSQVSQIAAGPATRVCYAFAAPLWADRSSQSAFALAYEDAAGVMPGPWAALAYDAALLMLDALEEDANASIGRPSRSGVVARLGEQLDQEGEHVFSRRERRNTQTVFYCYGRGHPYPGQVWQAP